MAFDLRSLAFFRIALGLLVLISNSLLIPDFNAFYRASGIASGGRSETLPQALLWFLIPVFATSLSLGFLTRVSTFACLVSVLLVQNDNSQILQGGDVLLRLLLFWSMFLPLSSVWTVPSPFRKSSRSLPLTTASAPCVFTLQICLLYWTAALLKSDPLWTQTGNALFYALNVEHFTSPFGLQLRQYPNALCFLTFLTPIFELMVPFLLLIPYRREVLRFVAVILFIGFHLIGMQAMLRIGLFPWACAVAWLVFIPGFFWNWISQRMLGYPKKTEGKPESPRPQSRRARLPKSSLSVLDVTCSGFIVLSFFDVLLWNVSSLVGGDARRWIETHDTFGSTLGLKQHWNMYAPYPWNSHGWLVVPANLADGTQVDLFTGKDIQWEKPPDIGAHLGNDRWRRYLSNLFNFQNPTDLAKYAAYLVQRWNNHHGQDRRVESVEIVFMKQVTRPDLTVSEPEKNVLYFQAF